MNRLPQWLCLLILLLSNPLAYGQALNYVTANLPPYTVDKSEAEPGFMYELLQLVHAKAGFDFQPKFLSWKRAQVETKEAANLHHLIFSLTRTSAREAQYKWILKLGPTKTAFVRLAGNDPINSVGQAKSLGISVGVNQETPWHRYLNKEGLTDAKLVSNEEFNAKKLIAGRIDAWYVPVDRALYYLKKHGLTQQPVVGEALQGGELYLAANLNFPEELAEELRVGLSKALEEVKGEPEYQALFNKYFGFE